MTAPFLPGISIRLIQELVARRYGVPPETMTGPSRLREFAWPRQLAMVLAQEFTSHSNSNIGRYFGRDHSTVWWAAIAVAERAKSDPDTREHLALLRALLAQMRPKAVEGQDELHEREAA